MTGRVHATVRTLTGAAAVLAVTCVASPAWGAPAAVPTGASATVSGSGDARALPELGTDPIRASGPVSPEVVEEPLVVPDQAVAPLVGETDAPDATDDGGPEPVTDPVPDLVGPDDQVVLASGAPSTLSLVAVTWDEATGSDDLDVSVRTRTGAEWSTWAPVEVEAESPEGTSGDGARAGTEPVLLQDVDEVAVALSATTLPSDPRIVLIDPGAGPSDKPEGRPESPAASRSSSRAVDSSTVVAAARTDVLDSAPTAALAVPNLGVGAPQILSRADWGADESLMTWTPEIGRVTKAVVHHTAGINDYTAEQVPSIIRGIYAYHAVSRGWGDIGYNILIDKFGRAWEGRAGGLDRAVVGGHAVGQNALSFGVSVMGNFETASMTPAATETLARVLAWKLGLHGVVPGPTTVVGHRDVAQTACPGRELYALLPSLRSRAAALQTAGGRDQVRDLNGDGYTDLLLATGSTVSLLTAERAGWESPRTVGSGWTGSRTIAPGDWNRDGNPDLMLIDGGSGSLWLYPGTSSGGWQPRRLIGSGWQIMDRVVGGRDWDGDGRPDLLARVASSGDLWLYPSDGRGGFGSARRVGTGWSSMATITTIGNVGGAPALVARRTDGVLFTYRGDGRGGFSGAPVSIGGGWGGMNLVLGVGDATGDGEVDLVARDTAGRMWQYVGRGDGTFGGPTLIGTSWNSFTTVLSAGRAGPGQDYFAVTQSGALLRYSHRGGAAFSRRVSTPVPTASAAEVIAPGDWDGDGRADLMVRRTNGDLVLYRGVAGGTFTSTGTVVGRGWSGMSQVVAATDWLGTGVPSLVALDRTAGRIWLYPGDGRGGFAAPSLLATGASNVDRIVTAGRFSGGRAPDLLVREASTGKLHLRAGNGGGLLGSPQLVGTGWQGFSAVVGAGDVDADGLPDLLTVGADRVVRLYPGDGRGGFRAARALVTAPAGQVS